MMHEGLRGISRVGAVVRSMQRRKGTKGDEGKREGQVSRKRDAGETTSGRLNESTDWNRSYFA